MGVIQSGINRTLGMAAAGAMAYKAKKEAANKLLEKQKQAADKVKQVQQAKKTQRRNFMAYLGKMETSLGGTVAELPKNVQHEIAKTYTRSQRKTIMDRMDRENAKK